MRARGALIPERTAVAPARHHVITSRGVLDSLAAAAEAADDGTYVPPDPLTGEPSPLFESSVRESAAVVRAAPAAIALENRGVYIRDTEYLASRGPETIARMLTAYGLEVMGLGAALENMWLAANALGVQAAFLGDLAIASPAARDLLGLEGDLVGVLALGYPDVAPTRAAMHPTRRRPTPRSSGTERGRHRVHQMPSDNRLRPMNADGGTGDSSLARWFTVFREQSAKPDEVGTLRRRPAPKRLGGGRSGAAAALFLAPSAAAPSAAAPANEAIVLKWDRLDKVLNEATARRDRTEQRQNVDLLRARGASHVAVRVDPSTGELFGVMAYPYVGPLSDQGRIGDLQHVIRGEYIVSEPTRVLDHDFADLFDKVLSEFGEATPTDDGVTPASTLIADLPDLANFDEFLDIARGPTVEQSTAGAVVLALVDDWATKRMGIQQVPSFADSRLIHGDPRFANVMVDPVQHRVELIDYGAGEAGRHVFRDLARIEVDVFLRVSETGSSLEPDREQMIAARAAEALAPKADPAAQDQRVRIAELWRESRDNHFSRLRNTADRELYSLFVVTELLRRLKWHSEGNDVSDIGGTVPEIMASIGAVIRAVP